MPITLECPSCRKLTSLNDPAGGPIPCSGCGQLLRAPKADVGSLLEGGAGTASSAPGPNAAGSPWADVSPRGASPGETFRPVESNNPYQSPVLFDTPKQVGWTGDTDPRVASRFVRWLGAVIDNFFLAGLVIGGILVSAGFVEDDGDNDLLIAVIVYSWLGLGVLIQSALIAMHGQTVGKLLLGTKIVNLNDDDKPGFLRGVVLRYWLQFVLSIVPFFSLLDAMFIFAGDKRCIHDHMAGTRVIHIR
jgi:uncharacterized RDD family membrane protein YckC